MNYELFKEMLDEDRRESWRQAERVQEEGQRINGHIQLLDAMSEQVSMIDDLKYQVERQRSEIDDLEQQLEQREAEIAELRQQHQAEIDALQKQLLVAQNEHLESEKQHLESEKQHLESEKQLLAAEVKAKPMEIHNHFGAGSNSQVFNSKVNGKFTKQTIKIRRRKDGRK
jgi:chromosome segregation ATPase